MPAAHRDGDARTCGATTVVVGQSVTYVDGRLWSVAGDINTDGDGMLIPSFTGVFINGLPVIVNTPDDAKPDLKCPILNFDHCEPKTAGGSGSTFAYG
jgi:uncharacterized Zn-binding protein involved in type VI secretion